MKFVFLFIPFILGQLSNWQLQQKYRELKQHLVLGSNYSVREMSVLQRKLSLTRDSDPLRVKANRRFNAYDYTLEQIGKQGVKKIML